MAVGVTGPRAVNELGPVIPGRVWELPQGICLILESLMQSGGISELFYWLKQ